MDLRIFVGDELIASIPEIPINLVPVLRAICDDKEFRESLVEIPRVIEFLPSLNRWGTLRLKDRYDDRSPLSVSALPIDTEKADRALLAKSMAELNMLKRRVSGAGNFAETIGSNLDELSRKLGESMLAEELDKFTQDGVNFKLEQDEFFQINKERMLEAFIWLRIHGHGGIIKEDVHFQSLRSALSQPSVDDAGNLPEPENIDPLFVLEGYLDRINAAQAEMQQAVAALRENGTPTTADFPPEELFKRTAIVKAKITKQ
jgi:hypothetical protein